MKKAQLYCTFIALTLLPASGWAYADSTSGVATLQSFFHTTIRTTLPANTRPLFTPKEQETYLLEMEGTPPEWDTLHHQPGEEHGERLFDFNRARDEQREGHPLLTQRVAFLWSGILRKFNPEQGGFTVAMGPDLTLTTWGIMRFKPVGLPNDMIAVPSEHHRASLNAKVLHKEEVEVIILFLGTLIPNESIMYAFSHDGNEDGMIMPFVQIDKVEYFLME